MIGDRVQIDVAQIVARLARDVDRRSVGTEDQRIVPQLIGVVQAADDLADAAAKMARHELELRELLEHTSDDEAREGERRVEWPSDAGRQTEFPHALLAEADRRWVHEHGNIEIAGELEERPRIVVVRKGAAVARIDQHAAQVVLLYRALEFAQVLVAATRDRDCERDELSLVLVAQRGEILVRL